MSLKLAADHGYPKDGTDALEAFKNERDYIGQRGKLKTTVAAMDWAIAQIEMLRAALKMVDFDIRHHIRSDEISAVLIRREAAQAVRDALDQ